MRGVRCKVEGKYGGRVRVRGGSTGACFSLEIYFQMVHSTVGRYENLSLYTTIEVGTPG